jgi:hypothetical protein
MLVPRNWRSTAGDGDRARVWRRGAMVVVERADATRVSAQAMTAEVFGS